MSLQTLYLLSDITQTDKIRIYSNLIHVSEKTCCRNRVNDECYDLGREQGADLSQNPLFGHRIARFESDLSKILTFSFLLAPCKLLVLIIRFICVYTVFKIKILLIIPLVSLQYSIQDFKQYQ